MTKEKQQYDVDDYLKQIEDHIELGRYRLEEAYGYRDQNYRDDSSKTLDRAPHQLLIEDASELIAESAEMSSRDKILRGVGVEILLNGVYMKINTPGYIEHLRENGGKSPRYSESRRVLIGDLAHKLNGKAKRRVRLVLKVIRKQRNNRVHFSLHKYDNIAFEPTALRTLCFLLKHYSEQDLDYVDRINSRIHELEKANTGKSFPKVEFEVAQ